MKKKTTRDMVSVIITYHNEGPLLSRALESVFRQEFDGLLEVVVVDDASSVRPRVGSNTPFPVRLIRTEANIGLSAARNLGIESAQGDLLSFLDADDEYTAQRVTAHVDFLKRQPDVILVGGPHWMCRETEWLQTPHVLEHCYPHLTNQEGVLDENVRFNLCMYYGFTSGSTTIRRFALEQIGGFRHDRQFYEEWDCYVRLAQIGRFGFVPVPSYRYIMRPGSMTTTLYPEKFESNARMFREWRVTIAGLPKDYSLLLRQRERDNLLLAAQVYLEQRHQPGSAFRCALRSLRSKPSIWGLRSLVRAGLHGILKHSSIN